MKNFRILGALSVVMLLIVSNVSLAENWPKFRGPNGDGTSAEANLPTKWDATTNVIWKTPIPGNGYASPIVWEVRIFT